MKQIILSNGGVAWVDDEDFASLSRYNWRKWIGKGMTYAVRTRTMSDPETPHTIKMHRVIASAESGMDVDHVNGDRLDNRRANLRVCTRAENTRNRKKLTGTSSPYKGVYWHRRAGKWAAQIKKLTKHVYLGLFDDPIEAASAYDSAAVIAFGAFAKLNFPHKEIAK